MEFLILLAALGIIGLISSRRWRRQLIFPLIGVVLFCGITFSSPAIALAHWGLVIGLPTDSKEVVDAIVVLGRGEELRERRVEAASELWQLKRAPGIFVSGMLDAREVIESLIENGLPKQKMAGESCSQTTEENAQFTTALLRPRKIRKILLVTDSPHMRRSLLVFRSFGFIVIPYPLSLPAYWSKAQQMKSILREYIALAGYAMTGRFKQRSIQELNYPSANIFEKLKSWNCRI